MLRPVPSLLICLTLATTLARAQEQVPVKVGAGSYASSPPPGAPDGLGKIETQSLFLVNHDDRPLPTNKWWTQLLVSKYAKSLWAAPLKVDAGEKGLEIFFPIKWRPDGTDPETDAPLSLGGKDFKPADSRAKDWSDWLVSFRMGESADRYMDVTLGEGMPSVWVEYHGVDPLLNFPPGVTPKFFDLSGRPVSRDLTSDSLGIEFAGRRFGIFAPDQTRFSLSPRELSVAFSGASHYLVVVALPAAKDLAYFHKYAFAVPRETQFSWKYDAAHGVVTTLWNIKAEALKGSQTQVIQGWIPHHYHTAVNTLSFNGLDYLSPRGKLRCTVGNEFTITYPFNGIVPNLPAPKAAGGADDYQPARMHAYLQDLAGKQNFGADTYWGGKDIRRSGQCALIAQQIKDPLYSLFVKSLRGAMEDWFSFSPGKKDHYFCYYPIFHSLVGVHPSYGSEAFNDHHFHYSYFTFASALLAMHDEKFAADFGPMATLVARDYANWDRGDKRFPFLRTFDPWAGHSWAGGTSSPGGNNQESSSEAVQGWAGLILLGQSLADSDMTAAGVMGYAVESEATLDYWFNATGDTFPPEWKHPVTGMIWGGGKAYGTYFTGDPAWIYAIQWLPASPMLSYLVRDPAAARKRYEEMKADSLAHEKADAARQKPGDPPHEVRQPDIKSFGAGLGSVMLGYVLMYDPQWVCKQLDTLWSEPNDQVAHNAGEMTVIYYQAHAMRNLGLADFTLHADSPTAVAYTDEKTKQTTFITWNPTTKPQKVTFYSADKTLGTMTALPQQLTSTTHLMAPQ